jgi:hypothetical protein
VTDVCAPQVCEKVESKGTTTYNEVADELVAEMKGSQLEDGVVYDEKNIRWAASPAWWGGGGQG